MKTVGVVALISQCVNALGGLKIKAAQGSNVAADKNLLASIRAEARAHMRAMLGQSFLESPKPLDANGLKNALYTTQQLRGPASGINVVEKRGVAMSDSEAVDLKKKFYLDLARGMKSFLSRPHQEVNIAIASFLEAQEKEIAMQEADSRRAAFVEELFSAKPVVTVGLSPAPESFLQGDGVRLQVASEPSRQGFLSTDVRVQAGSRSWPSSFLGNVFSFLSKGADLGDLEKVAAANLAAAQAYNEASSSLHTSFVEGPADQFLTKLIQRRAGGNTVSDMYQRKTQAPMVWMRFH